MKTKKSSHHKQHQRTTTSQKEIPLKKELRKKRSLFSIIPIIPQLIVIGVCIGIYYAMINYYLFFEWGFYIYYVIKIVIAFEILSASIRSLLVPFAALIIGLIALFANNIYLNTLMDVYTAWELITISVIGILLTFIIRARKQN